MLVSRHFGQGSKYAIPWLRRSARSVGRPPFVESGVLNLPLQRGRFGGCDISGGVLDDAPSVEQQADLNDSATGSEQRRFRSSPHANPPGSWRLLGAESLWLSTGTSLLCHALAASIVLAVMTLRENGDLRPRI